MTLAGKYINISISVGLISHQVITRATKASAWHRTFHAYILHYFSEIRSPIDVKINNMTFNEVSRFIANIFDCGRVASIAIKRNDINSLAPGRFERSLRKVIFKLILMIGGWGILCKIALRWMPMDLTDDNSTLVQVMAWCRQATSRCLSQCWPRSMSPYGVTRPQWVKCVK